MRGGVPAPAPGGAAHGRLSALGSTFSAALAATGARGAVGAAVAASALAAGGALASPEALANEAFAIAGPGTPSRKYVASAANDPFDAAVERAVARGSPSASPRAPQADLDIPDGFVLVNAAEAAAAAQRLASLRAFHRLCALSRRDQRRFSNPLPPPTTHALTRHAHTSFFSFICVQERSSFYLFRNACSCVVR